MTLSRINHLGAAAPTTLNGSITASSSSLTLASGTGYPTANFVIKLDAGTSAEEKVLVGSRSGVTCSSLTRGYDGTTATSHSSGAAVEHDLAAVVIDDANDHVYTTTRDDHTQYLRTDGTRATTGAQTIGGALTVSSGGIAVTGNSKVTGTLEVTSALTVDAGGVAVTGASTFSSTVQATALTATLTGTNGRYVGATSGAPSSGTYSTNDFANDPTNGCFWICTAGGSPGTWEQTGSLTSWTSWTPTFSATGGGASAGNATFDAAYQQIGKLLNLRMSMTVGSTTNGGSGFWQWALPNSLSAKSANQLLPARVISGSNTWLGQSSVTGDVQHINLVLPTSSSNNLLEFVTATVPFNETSGTQIIISGTIEVA